MLGRLSRSSIKTTRSGPFWIATTVVFVMFVVGNMAASLRTYETGQDFVPDFTGLSLAATVVYTYVFGVPLLLWGGLRYAAVPASVVDLWCLYGYALAIFVPVSIICIIPVEAVKWAFAMLALATSGLFMTTNLWPLASQASAKVATVTAVLVLLGQAGLTLCFKFVFYSHY